MADTEQGNGWAEYKRLVLSEIEDMNASLKDLKEEIASMHEHQTKIREDISSLKAQSGIIGGLAGAASSFLGTLISK